MKKKKNLNIEQKENKRKQLQTTFGLYAQYVCVRVYVCVCACVLVQRSADTPGALCEYLYSGTDASLLASCSWWSWGMGEPSLLRHSGVCRPLDGGDSSPWWVGEAGALLRRRKKFTGDGDFLIGGVSQHSATLLRRPGRFGCTH